MRRGREVMAVPDGEGDSRGSDERGDTRSRRKWTRSVVAPVWESRPAPAGIYYADVMRPGAAAGLTDLGGRKPTWAPPLLPSLFVQIVADPSPFLTITHDPHAPCTITRRHARLRLPHPPWSPQCVSCALKRTIPNPPQLPSAC